MKWIQQDMDMFLKAREYIDTVIIPLIRISVTDDIKESLVMAEVTNMLCLQLENQFKGRVLLLPAFNYIKSEDVHISCDELKRWEPVLSENGFKHIIYVTIDNKWLEKEQELDGKFLTCSYMPLNEIEEVYHQQFFQDWLKELVEQLKNTWKNRQE